MGVLNSCEKLLIKSERGISIPASFSEESMPTDVSFFAISFPIFYIDINSDMFFSPYWSSFRDSYHPAPAPPEYLHNALLYGP